MDLTDNVIKEVQQKEGLIVSATVVPVWSMTA